MPKLRAHRRDRRARAPERRKRRNLVKFIPNADSDFAFMAQSLFLHRLQKRPEAYGLALEQIAEIEQAVAEFRGVLASATTQRNPEFTSAKKQTRIRAEQVIRRYGSIIRANPDVNEADKVFLRLRGGRPRARRRRCPQDPPLLRFLGSGDGVAQAAGTGNGSGVHVLDVRSHTVRHAQDRELGRFRRTKPDGAVRVEIFVELVPAGHDVPHHPAELTGRPWYLGSFTTSRIEVSYPIPSEPMLVVYFARWADARGGVGRFSQPCPARAEGWTRVRPALPESDAGRRIETKVVFVQVSRHEPEALPHYDSDDGALPEHPRRQVEAVTVKRLPEVA